MYILNKLSKISVPIFDSIFEIGTILGLKYNKNSKNTNN